MAAAGPARTSILYGWGVHGLPFCGINYNISGYDCVKVAFRQPRGLLRFTHIHIGTDDPEGLASFLQSKITP